MSAMSRLATELHLVRAGEIDASQQFRDVLVALGYEPAEYVTELDVCDNPLVHCAECDYADVAGEMVAQHDGEFLCPGCDYDHVIEWRNNQRALARLAR